VPARIRFLSIEPLLGPVNLLGKPNAKPIYSETGAVTHRPVFDHPLLAGIDWVIVGGESGKDARPMHPNWARSLRDQCQAAGVPYLFKQWGEWGFDPRTIAARGTMFHTFEDGTIMQNYGKKAAGRLLDDREWNEFPEAA